MIAAAFGIMFYNIEAQKTAGTVSQDILNELDVDIPVGDDADIPQGAAASSGGSKFPQTVDFLESRWDPYSRTGVYGEMTERAVYGGLYIATLYIPSLELVLPVNAEWNMENLRIVPCRYTGSIFEDDMVICAHNYNSHFGRLKYLKAGDIVYLTDMDGKTVQYEVIAQEVLGAYSFEEMTSGDWDLTLFTCTVSGSKRVTVRCVRV